jgi:CubicO group peptidase (beta-lactamase class C family)
VSRLDALAASVPSLVAAVSDGEVSSYGFSDLEKKTPASGSTSYGIGSTTKIFTALTAMRLASDGLLDLHEPVSSVLGDDPLLSDATCHHLLTHTSGIPPLHARFAAFAEGPVPDRSGGTGATPDWARELSTPGLDYVDAAGLLDYLSHFRIRRLAAPGRVFSYSNEGYILLSAVIAKAAGTTFEDACRDAVLEPLGLTSTAFHGTLRANHLPDVAVPHHPDGTPTEWWAAPAWSAPGGLLSSAEDLLALASAIQTRSVPGVRPGFIEAMCARHTERSSGGYYGYGVAGFPRGSGFLLGHGGARVGSACSLLWTEGRPRAAAALSNVLGAPVDAAAHAVLGLKPVRRAAVPELPREVLRLERLVGTYWAAEAGYVTVRIGEAGLEALYLGRTIPLSAESTTRFVSPQTGMRLEFLVEGSRPAWAVSIGERLATRRKAVSPWPLATSRS